MRSKRRCSRVPSEEWKRLDSHREWAEVGYVPTELAHSKKGHLYRYLAIREILRQPILPGMELPFQTVPVEECSISSVGLCRTWTGQGRGLSVLPMNGAAKARRPIPSSKRIFRGKAPSGNFGENAAWWWIMVLAFNLNTAMKQFALGLSFAAKRMKALRFSVIALPGRIVDHARQLVIRLAKAHPSFVILTEARQRIMRLALSG